MPETLRLADHASRDDLRMTLERVLRVGRPEVRLVARSNVLAVFGCTQAPEGLGDPVSTVLVLRSFALARLPEVAAGVPEADVVVLARSLLDRIARMGPLGLDLELPDSEVTVAWAGVLPPVSGWQAAGAIDAGSLAEVAAQGITMIAEALPLAPGDAVVRRARREVWEQEIAPGLPAAAAFAAEAMGFLGAEGADPADRLPARMSTTLTWSRLTTDRGEVLVRGFVR